MGSFHPSRALRSMRQVDIAWPMPAAKLGLITTTVGTYGHLLPSALGYVRDALSAALSASRPELVG